MSANTEPLAIAEIDRSAEGLNVREALLAREFEYLADGGVLMTETWNGQHPACPYAVADLSNLTLRTDIAVVGRRIKMTFDEWRERYSRTALN